MRSGQGLARAVLIVVIVLNLLPLIYMLGISLKPEDMIFRHPLLPVSLPLTLANYAKVWQVQPVAIMVFNSLFVAFAVTLGQMFLAALGAYGFSRYRFRLKNVLFGFVLVSMMVPFVVTYLPNYLMLSKLRLTDTRAGMVIPMLGLSLGAPVFLLRQYFMTFPSAITDAARMDGTNDWQILWRIMVPGCLPGFVSIAVYVLINCWNQYIWPRLIAERVERFTLPVGVVSFMSGEGGAMWGAVMAASVITVLPTVALFLALRRPIIQNLSQGAFK